MIDSSALEIGDKIRVTLVELPVTDVSAAGFQLDNSIWLLDTDVAEAVIRVEGKSK